MNQKPTTKGKKMKCYTTGELMRMSHDDLREHAQKLQSEHTALLAVAEVMRRQAQGHGRNYSGGKCPCAACQALATLAQIQKGE